ncbi:hypothetical protein [Endozoicomonas sp. ONNA2]|uniref:hypothetical protein n=1 Tax=Endozoicomonas sp. ONNA2 TaxID=2828741 RepID=UPI002148F237|nr:hypothetical protein [Endozoicomonas sp. ONNA2]
MQPTACQNSEAKIAHGLASPTPETDNPPKSIAAPCWRGFSTRFQDIAENARFLNHIVATTRHEVLGSNHITKDIDIDFPTLKPEDIQRMKQQRGPFVTREVVNMNAGCKYLEEKFKQSHKSYNSRESRIYYQFCVKNGFGNCGPQMYQCQQNLLKAGVPADIIWTLELVGKPDNNTPHLAAHGMVLIADNPSMIQLFDQINVATAKYGIEYDARPGIAMDITELFTLLKSRLPNAIFVDPFFNRIIPSIVLNTTSAGIARNFGLRGDYSVKFTGSQDYRPITDDEVNSFEQNIKSDEKAVKAMQLITKVKHYIQLKGLMQALAIALEHKQKISDSINKSEFGLAFRQSSFYKANSVFDYLFDHADELDFELNSSGNSGNTALDYAKKAGNSHAIARLEALMASSTEST